MKYPTRNLPLALERGAFVLDRECLRPAGLRRAVVDLLEGPRTALIAWAQADLDTPWAPA